MFPFGALLSGEPELEVTADNVSGSDSDFAACGVVSSSGDPPNTVVSNGSGSYTYSWEQIGTPAQNGPYSISSAVVANPFWTDTVCDIDIPSFEQWKLTVIDTVTEETASVTITVQLVWTNLS